MDIKKEYKRWGREQCKSIMDGRRCTQPVIEESEYCYYCYKLDKGLLEPLRGIFVEGKIVMPKVIERKIIG